NTNIVRVLLQNKSNIIKASVRKDSPRYVYQCTEVTSPTFEASDNDNSTRYLFWKENSGPSFAPFGKPYSFSVSSILQELVYQNLKPQILTSIKILTFYTESSNPKTTGKHHIFPEQNGMQQRSRQQSPDRHYREYTSKATGEGRADTFHERVDRHGNIFGARVATKQTRVPPPPKALENIRDDHHSWRGKGMEAETETQIQSYNSPPYTKRRDLGKERNRLKKVPFPQRGLSEWRVKPTEAAPSSDHRVSPGRMSLQNPVLQNTQGKAPQEANKEQTEAQILNELNEATLLYLSCPDPTEAAAMRQRVLAGDAMGQTQERGSSSDQRKETTQHLQIPSTSSKEQVMRELQETTKQYLSCVDPVEAAARRQRVLAGDAEGLMEKTAEAILARSAEQRRPLSPWERGIKSVSPPGIDFDVAMQPSDIEDTPLPAMRRATPHQDVDSLLERQVQSPNDGINSGRLKSIIVTPTEVRSEEQEEAREVVEIADDKENLLQFQSKKKKRSSNSIILRSPRLYPSILRGASSKKRKLSQIQHSPGNGKKTSGWRELKGSQNVSNNQARSKNKNHCPNDRKKPCNTTNSCNMQWKQEKIECYLPLLTKEIQLIQPSLSKAEDSFVWQPLPSGVYTTRSVVAFKRAVCLPPTGITCTILPWVCWSLWNARNQLIFEDKTLSSIETASKGMRLARKWITAQHPSILSPKLIPRTTKRTNPRMEDSSSSICRTDAAWNIQSKRAGLAWIFSDTTGSWIN
ncbi:hypothetical protein IGI04_036778, partial [Brassica rapa subsp. trilocularis]